MVLKQYYLGCLAHASYLLGDEASSTAIIVDPQRDIHQYLVDTEKFGLEIRHVFLTHFHASRTKPCVLSARRALLGYGISRP
jgi:hydroxyacylglutathione hydrolase